MTSVNLLLNILFVLVAVGVLLRFSKARIGMLQFPFLAAAVMIGWVLTQFISLSLDESVPQAPIAKTIFYTTFFLLFGWLGYASNSRPARLCARPYSNSRLLAAGYVLSLFGAFFFLKVTSLAQEATELTGGLWTGPITIYAFFASTLSIGTAIAATVYARKQTVSSLVLLLLGISFVLHRVAINGRREDAVSLFILILFLVYFRWRWVPPRWSVFAVIAAGTLFVASIGDYRGITLQVQAARQSGFSFAAIADINFVGNFTQSFRNNQGGELLNAAMIIEGVERSGKLDLGLSLWNHLIHSYVPGQLVGYELKNALTFPLANVAVEEMGHRFRTGTTLTGMAESFRSFWYFGILVFFLIGIIMSRWFKSAMRGNIAAQIMIIMITPKSLIAITHGTNAFLSEFIALAVFLGPALFFARRTAGSRVSGRANTSNLHVQSPS